MKLEKPVRFPFVPPLIRPPRGARFTPAAFAGGPKAGFSGRISLTLLLGRTNEGERRGEG